jgi:hypothetical protein
LGDDIVVSFYFGRQEWGTEEVFEHVDDAVEEF